MHNLLLPKMSYMSQLFLSFHLLLMQVIKVLSHIRSSSWINIMTKHVTHVPFFISNMLIDYGIEKYLYPKKSTDPRDYDILDMAFLADKGVTFVADWDTPIKVIPIFFSSSVKI